ncbi:hypothetical protein [Glaciecola sp. SC05]|uniref:hypothetical protein n=1 Tax=Glaciecola sp. SC05 TaxID=1987355 RepID=UPI003527F653
MLSILAYLILFFVLSTIIGIVLISLGFDDAFKDFNFVITIGVSIISFGALYAAREYILKKRATGLKATHISN